MTTQDIEEVKSIINNKFNEGANIISIDGWTGAGKTYLLKNFNDSETIFLISFDDYFEKNTGLYLEVFQYDDLKEKINGLLEENKKILIEGICMEQVLGKKNVKVDYSVYIKQLGISNDWHYDKYLDESKTDEEIFKEDEEFFKIDLFEDNGNSNNDDQKFEDDELTKERRGVFYDLVRYNREYNPNENCDLLFENPYRVNG